MKAMKFLTCELVDLPYNTCTAIWGYPRKGTRVRLECNDSGVAVMYDRTFWSWWWLTGKKKSYNLGYIPDPYGPVIQELLDWGVGKALKVRIRDFYPGDDDFDKWLEYGWCKPDREDGPIEAPCFIEVPYFIVTIEF